jgi:GDPmannose 4,6-dehydratase
MKKAIVIGARGQDGSLLSKLLRESGYHVTGIGRGDLDIGDPRAVQNLLSKGCDEIYYLAAHHHSSQDSRLSGDRELFEKSHAVHVTGLLNFLDAIRSDSPDTRLFYASSSLVFGSPQTEPQSESTPLNPTCIYGITKACGMHLCRNYREKHGLFAATGILFNHESPLRQPKFVIPKIIRAAIAISRGSGEKLQLGNLSARVDWGYAPDYVDAMHRILGLERPDDFVTATGETHSVQDVVEIVFGKLGLEWQRHVIESPTLLTRNRSLLRGDSSKLHKATGWKPTVGFKQMILDLLETAQNG